MVACEEWVVTVTTSVASNSVATGSEMLVQRWTISCSAIVAIKNSIHVQ